MSHRAARRRPLALIVGIAIAGAPACKDSSTPPELSQPAKLTLVSGDNQSGNGALLPTALVVKITDPRNEPVSGVAVSWTTSDPTASLSAVTASTDADGLATAKWTLGASAGRQTVTVTTPSIPGAQAVF